MFNLPPNIFQNMPWLQNLQGGGAGNSKKWSETNPFRTVDNGSQYGSGNNASAGQLYNHFHRKAALDKQAGNENASISDYGLTPGHKVQSISDFLDRRNQGNEDASGIWGNHTQAYKDRVGELMENRGWTQQYSMGNQNHALGVGADFGGDGAVGNNEWARHLGADSDGDGNVTNQEWAQYKGQQGQQGQRGLTRPGNIPGMGPGIFNFQPPMNQQPGVNQPGGQPAKPPNMSDQEYMAICGMPPPNPQPQKQYGGLTDMLGGMQNQINPPSSPTGTMNNLMGALPGQGQPAQPQMPGNPQVPQFDPSIFNMQPNMGGQLPNMGGQVPNPFSNPRARGVM